MTDDVKTEDQTDTKLREYGLMFAKLVESQRFQELMGLYFTFTKVVNEETKEIEFNVIENPPEVVAQKMQGKHQEKETSIQVVSGARAEKVLAQAKRAANNNGGRRWKDPKGR